MQRFIDFFNRFREFITFLMLVVISLSLISLGNTNKIGGFRAVLVGTIGWMQSAMSWVPNPQALKNENASLRELNHQLSIEVTKMRQSLIENKYLRDQLNLKKNLEVPFVIADVVGKTSVEMRNYIVINKGTKDGIFSGMAVRNDAGLIGLVFSASSQFSMIEALNNPTVKIAARVQRTRNDGILVWEGGENLIMKNIPKSFDMKVDDVILSSEYSNKYPAEVPIGKVIEVIEEPGDLFLKVIVKPYVNNSHLEQVFVLKKVPDQEINNLVNQVDEMIKNRKATLKGK
jgi:rod shape-determining protein MreC